MDLQIKEDLIKLSEFIDGAIHTIADEKVCGMLGVTYERIIKICKKLEIATNIFDKNNIEV